MARRNTSSDFWERVNKTSGCWLWAGGVSPQGYGRLHWRGQERAAHRVSWSLHTGRPIPRGNLVCHHCDTPLCVRPDHLYLGTAKTNAQDRDTRKRRDVRPGERHHNARLTAGDVVTIRNLAQTLTHKAIGEQFDISRQHVGDILRGECWQVAGGETRESHRVGRPPALGADEVEELLALRATGATQAELAERFGLTQSGVSKYLKRHG
jgi:predicted XRE-type DNA-binding protein